MPTKRCGCASDSCACTVVAGDGMTVTGAGSDSNPYIVTSNVSDIETGFDVQYNNVNVVRDVHRLDFRGSAISISPGTDEAVVTVTVPDPTSGAVIPTGAIWMFGMTSEPTGWLLCDGRTVTISAYPNLFAAISNHYGGDGISNFALPNLSGRFPIGQNATFPINGALGGSTTKAIAVTNLPPHNHAINHNHASFNTGDSGTHDHAIHSTGGDANNNTTVKQGASGGGNFKGPIQGDGSHKHAIDVPGFTGTSGNTGGAVALDIMPPYQAVAYMIKT